MPAPHHCGAGRTETVRDPLTRRRTGARPARAVCGERRRRRHRAAPPDGRCPGEGH